MELCTVIKGAVTNAYSLISMLQALVTHHYFPTATCFALAKALVR